MEKEWRSTREYGSMLDRIVKWGCGSNKHVGRQPRKARRLEGFFVRGALAPPPKARHGESGSKGSKRAAKSGGGGKLRQS